MTGKFRSAGALLALIGDFPPQVRRRLRACDGCSTIRRATGRKVWCRKHRAEAAGAIARALRAAVAPRGGE